MPRLSTCSEFLGPTLPANPLRFFLVRKATNPKLHRGAWNKSRGSGFLEKSLRNFPSAIQSAPRRLDASCRSAHGPVLWSENSPVFQALEQVSLCPTWRAKRASACSFFRGNNPQPRNQRSIRAEQDSDTRGITALTLR